MKKMLAALAVSLSIPCVALAATWDNVSLIDQMCAQKEKVTANPDKHHVACSSARTAATGSRRATGST